MDKLRVLESYQFLLFLRFLLLGPLLYLVFRLLAVGPPGTESGSEGVVSRKPIPEGHGVVVDTFLFPDP